MIDKAADNQKSPVPLEEVVFEFAVDRQDTRTLMELLPPEVDTNRNTVEYELQILRIVTVGWSLSVYLEDHPRKIEVEESYWRAIHSFATQISSTTGLMIGKEVDYFSILKERLDGYVAALREQPAAPEPAAVIGPEFARLCGADEDIFTIMTGSRMFVATVTAVRKLLKTQ